VNRPWRSLRVRLATLGFLAIYLPALLLFGVILATDTEVTVHTGQPTQSTRHLSGWPLGTLLALGPAAAVLAWWWAGRAVGPLHRVRAVAEDIEATDLSRRISLDHGPVEVTALAASFDAMLDRLEAAAEVQRRLIEETSHELRVPLAVLMTNAEVLLAHPAPTVEVYRQGLERDKATAERLRRTIDELLVDARGRARTLDRRPVDLMSAVRAVIDDAGVLAAGRELTIAVDGPAAMVCRVDEPTVRRAVSNLLDNAIRHAPRGSTVHVQVERSAEQIAVTVTDHGPGIPPTEQEHIFERFWHRGDATTGLGLPIASQIAQAHGGTVAVTSPGPDGSGAVFRLTLR
jgi:signal transduction histidine kinase